MAQRKFTSIKVSPETAQILGELKAASGARSLDEEILNIAARVIVNGKVAHRLAEFFLMNAAVVEAEKIPASVQMEIHKRLDPRQIQENAARLVAEIRADLIEADKRARYAGAALGADPAAMPDVIDLPTVMSRRADPAGKSEPA